MTTADLNNVSPPPLGGGPGRGGVRSERRHSNTCARPGLLLPLTPSRKGRENRIFSLLLAFLAPLSATAQDPAPPDLGALTGKWTCESCPYRYGWSGSAELGEATSTDDSFKFGDYTGLNEEGGFVLGNLASGFSAANGNFLSVIGNDLGLDGRALSLSGGRQGLFRGALSYRQIPHLLSDTSFTPFLGDGSDTLRLPEGFRRGETTRDMPDLAASLHPVPIDVGRNILGAAFTYIPATHWETSIAFRRDRRDGIRVQGGNFFTNSTLLPLPVDDLTQQLDASAAYVRQTWQVRFAYYGSLYNAGHAATVWDNPFKSIAEGGDRGRLALAPDNDFHQLSLSGAWRPLARLHLYAQAALGRGSQNETFLPPTINPDLDAPPPPRDSLEGRVDTLDGTVRLTATPFTHLTVLLEGYANQRENKTPRDAFTQVESDSFVGDARVNRPYDFYKRGAKLDATYRFRGGWRLSAGGELQRFDRSLQEVKEMVTGRTWLEVGAHPLASLDTRLKLSFEKRQRNTPYVPLTDINPPENALLRKFNLADRERGEAEWTVAYSPLAWFNVGLTAALANDNYGRTVIGLTDGLDRRYGIDLSAAPFEQYTFYAFYTRERISSRFQGSQNDGPPDWFALVENVIQGAGAGVKATDVFRGLSLGLDLNYGNGSGKNDVTTSEPEPALPLLGNRLYGIRVYGEYPVTKRLAVGTDLRYERFSSEDFQLDGVEPDTIPNVLTLGADSPRYLVFVLGASLRYRFGD